MSQYFQHTNSLQQERDEEQSSVIKNMKATHSLCYQLLCTFKVNTNFGEHIFKLICGYFAMVDFDIGWILIWLYLVFVFMKSDATQFIILQISKVTEIKQCSSNIKSFELSFVYWSVGYRP